VTYEAVSTATRLSHKPETRKSDESGTGRDESGSVIRFAHGWPCAFVQRVA